MLISNRSSISADPAVRGQSARTWGKPCVPDFSTPPVCTGRFGRRPVGFAGWITFVREAALAALVDERISWRPATTCACTCSTPRSALRGGPAVPPVDNPVPASVGE